MEKMTQSLTHSIRFILSTIFKSGLSPNAFDSMSGGPEYLKRRFFGFYDVEKYVLFIRRGSNGRELD